MSSIRAVRTRGQNGNKSSLAALGFAALGGSAATLLVVALISSLDMPAPTLDERAAVPVTGELLLDPVTTSMQSEVVSDETTIVAFEVFVSADGVDAEDRGRSVDRPVRTAEFALELARSGDTIYFAAGSYAPLNVIDASDLTITGLDGARPVFSADGYDGFAGVLVQSSNRIVFEGLQIENSLWGIKAEDTFDLTLHDLVIEDIGQEGILISHNSSRIEISDSRISDTGRRPGNNGNTDFANFGEGIYIGTGGVLADGSYDQTSHVWIHDNQISFTTAEAIDIKPSVSNVEIHDNVIHDIATANSGAIVVGIGGRVSPDPQVVIERNVIFRISRTSPWRDGNAIVVSAPATVRHNVIWDTAHYGILVDSKLVSETSGSVQIFRNLVFDTGLGPIVDLSTAANENVSVEVFENLTGSRANEIVASRDDQSDAEFGLAMIAFLLDYEEPDGT